jgi:hypothetical protein
MSAIRGLGAGATAAFLDDPMMAVQQLAIEATRDERTQAHTERRAAQQERETHLDRADNEERAAAVARLAGALVGAASKVSQGSLGIASAAVGHCAAMEEANYLASESHHAPGSSVVDVGGRNAAANAKQAESTLNSTRSVVDGAFSATSGALDYVSEQHRLAGKQFEKQADRAREAADDARERAQNAGETAGRLMNRMEDIARAQRQAEDQRIANIRG